MLFLKFLIFVDGGEAQPDTDQWLDLSAWM